MCPECGRILVVCRCVGLLVSLVRQIAECVFFCAQFRKTVNPRQEERKMRNKRFGALAAAIGITVICGGCVSYHRDAGVDYLVRPQATGEICYTTQYEIGKQRITGRGSASVLLWVFQFSDGKYCQLNSNPHLSFLSLLWEFLSPAQKAVSNAKNTALYNACEDSDADQILGATFEYKITDYLVFSKVECTAKGFPARARGVELLEQKQPVILNNWQKIEYISPYETPKVYSGPEDATPPSAWVEK